MCAPAPDNARMHAGRLHAHAAYMRRVVKTRVLYDYARVSRGVTFKTRGARFKRPCFSDLVLTLADLAL